MTMDRRTIRHRLNSRAMIRPDRPREGAFALDGAFDVPLLSQRGERILKKGKKKARRKSEDRHKLEGYALSSGKKEASL
jgi:hypothetical protein